jgi:hypothetical protein
MTLQHFSRCVHGSACLVGQRLNANREPIQAGREDSHESQLGLHTARATIGCVISFAIVVESATRWIRISRNYWLAP